MQNISSYSNNTGLRNFNSNNSNNSNINNIHFSNNIVENLNYNKQTQEVEMFDPLAPIHLAQKAINYEPQEMVIDDWSVIDKIYEKLFKNYYEVPETTIDDWIICLDATIKDIENEKTSLEEQLADFIFKARNNEFPELAKFEFEIRSPDDIKFNYSLRDRFLIENGYTTSIVDENYQIGIDAFYRWIDEEYTPVFNKYFKESTNMTYEEYTDKITNYLQEISIKKVQKYSLDQQRKEQPYLELEETEEFKNYCKNATFDTSRISIDKQAAAYGNLVFYLDGEKAQYYNYGNLQNPINPVLVYEALNDGTISYKNNAKFDDKYNAELKKFFNDARIEYLNENEKMMYSYLFDTKGKSEADKYLEAIEDRLNQRKGQKKMEEFMAEITDENGNINYNLGTTLLANGEGILYGIQNFGEGIENIFATEGMISSNQYAQMYIMEALTNTSGAYINSLAEVILEKDGEEAANEFIRSIYDEETNELDMEKAKKVLTNEQYKTLEYKIYKDETTWVDESFQLGMSFGNMAPTMAVSFVLAYCGAGSTATSLISNCLMGVSSFGNSKNQALVSGNDLLSSTIYGIFSGTSETCFGYLLGNIPLMNSKATLSIFGILKEGTEEFLQEYIDAGLRAGILGEEINLDELSGDALKSFLFGCLMSFGTNAAQAGAKTVSTTIKLVINRKSVELNTFQDYVSFYKILNDSGILVEGKIDQDGNKNGVSKQIIIDESITNKPKMVELMKSIYKDADIYIKTKNGNITYEGYISKVNSNGNIFGINNSNQRQVNNNATEIKVQQENEVNVNQNSSMVINSLDNKTIMFSEAAEIAEYYGDAIQYAFFKLKEIAPYSVEFELKKFFSPYKLDDSGNAVLNKNGDLLSNGHKVNEINARQILDMADKYLSQEENVKINKMINDESNVFSAYASKIKNDEVAGEILDSFTRATGPLLAAIERKTITEFGGIKYDGNNVDDLNWRIIRDNVTKGRKNIEGFTSDNYRNIIDSLIDGAPETKNDMIVYRGVNGIYDGNTQLDPMALRPGDIISDAAFTSTSLLKNSGRWTSDRDIQMKIKVPAGSKALYIESFTGIINYNQQEMILPRNSSFQVSSYPYLENGKIILEFELVQNKDIISSTATELPQSNITDKLPQSNIIDKLPQSNITDKLPQSNITSKIIIESNFANNTVTPLSDFSNKPYLKELGLDKITIEGSFNSYYEQNKSQFGNKYKVNEASQIDVVQVIDDLSAIGYLEVLENNIREVVESGAYDDNLSNQEHGIDHAERVLLFATYIGIKENLSSGEMSLLIEAAKWHDCGRENVSTDKNHALASANKVGNYLPEGYTETDVNMIKAAIELHEVKDYDVNKISDICEKYKINKESQLSLFKIRDALKDADALDRTRFATGNLDPNQLRTNISKDLIKASFQLQEIRGSKQITSIPRQVVLTYKKQGNSDYWIAFNWKYNHKWRQNQIKMLN